VIPEGSPDMGSDDLCEMLKGDIVPEVIKNTAPIYKKSIRGHFYTMRIRKILRLTNPAGATVLDVGFGAGPLLAVLSRFTAQPNVYGLEASEAELLKARKAFRQIGLDGISLVVGDACDMTFREAIFDVVYCMDVLEHVKTTEAALREMKRVLKSTGTLAISLPSENVFYNIGRYTVGSRHKPKTHYWKPADITRQVKTLFRQVHVHYIPFRFAAFHHLIIARK
jgi:ubiquinone/menaquinone biosynthesis C-methylase UbiE